MCEYNDSYTLKKKIIILKLLVMLKNLMNRKFN